MGDTRQVLIRSSYDWHDVFADVLTVPAAIDVVAENTAWRAYLRDVFEPARKAYDTAPQSRKPKYPKCPTFIEWLRERGATDGTIEEFDDT